MKSEYIPKVITLLAGAVVCIISIVRDMNVTYSLEVLLVTLILFYIIGCVAQKIIMRVERSNRFIQQEREKALEEEKRREEQQNEEIPQEQEDETIMEGQQ